MHSAGATEGRFANLLIKPGDSIHGPDDDYREGGDATIPPVL